MSQAIISTERLHGGQPILSPQGEGWEGGAVSRGTVIHLRRSGEFDPVLRRLARNGDGPEPDLNSEGRLRDGAVAVCYEARPAGGENTGQGTSHIGLALFTPGLELIKRFPEPILGPSDDPQATDALGVADPRVTWINGAFWMTYCGVSGVGGPCICLARSSDLLRWEKLGPVIGDLAQFSSSHGVLLPEPVNGEFVMMHQAPMASLGASTIHLATSQGLDTTWRARGSVLSPHSGTQYEESWVSPGSTPLPLGDRRFLIVYNAGHWLKKGELRRGELGAAILNLQHPRLDEPSTVLEARLEPILVPETSFEILGSAAGGRANILSTSGLYEHQGSFIIVYSSGDAVLHGARVARHELMHQLETAGRAAVTAQTSR